VTGFKPFLTALALLGVAGMSGSPIAPADPAATASEGMSPQGSAEIRRLAEMAVAQQESLLASGEDAVFRNAAIPLGETRLETLSGGAGLARSGPAYDTALRCLAQAVYYEAANEPLRGRRAVAQVVLNRLRHPAYPDSVCGVVYEGANERICQFSFTCDGSLNRGPAPVLWREAEEIARQALAGRQERSVGTSTHYHADYVLPRWAFEMGKIGQIGRHIFYRFNGSWGSAGAFTRRWAGREEIPQIGPRPGKTDETALAAAEPEFVPGTTVTPDVRDRHAPSDVGGRIDTTKGWRPSIPNPVETRSAYSGTVQAHGELPAPGGRDDQALVYLNAQAEEAVK
jgi:hypothetical protein